MTPCSGIDFNVGVDTSSAQEGPRSKEMAGKNVSQDFRQRLLGASSMAAILAVGIAVGVACGPQLLMVDLQGVLHLFEQLSQVVRLIWIPRELSSLAIFPVVRLVHFRPVIGSPAVSCFINSSIRASTSGVFFYGGKVRLSKRASSWRRYASGSRRKR